MFSVRGGGQRAAPTAGRNQSAAGSSPGAPQSGVRSVCVCAWGGSSGFRRDVGRGRGSPTGRREGLSRVCIPHAVTGPAPKGVFLLRQTRSWGVSSHRTLGTQICGRSAGAAGPCGSDSAPSGCELLCFVILCGSASAKPVVGNERRSEVPLPNVRCVCWLRSAGITALLVSPACVNVFVSLPTAEGTFTSLFAAERENVQLDVQ